MPVKPSITEIKAFVAVVMTGSVTKAAGQRGRSASAISDAVRRFELRAGRALLKGHDGRLVPTDHGLVVYLRCQQLLDQHTRLFDLDSSA